MRRPLTAAALLAVSMLMSACAAAQPPQWTYAPATASPSVNPSAGASAGASAATSAAPSAPASAAASAAPASAPASGGSAAPASGSGGAASTSLDLTAQNVQFDKTALSAPASTAFVIHFNNQDQGIPHNVMIKDGTGKDVFKADLLTGPGKVDYNVPALPAGAYTFYCIVHPGMTGTLTVGP